MVDIKHSALLILVASIVTILLRFLPFIIFRDDRKMPVWLKKVADVLPPAIMAILILYCVRDSVFLYNGTLVASVLSLIVVVLLHLWKKNTLLSIFGGTVLYMVLIRVLPDNVFHLPVTVTATTSSVYVSQESVQQESETSVVKVISASKNDETNEVEEYQYCRYSMEEFDLLEAADLLPVNNPLEWQLYLGEGSEGILYIVDTSSDGSVTLYGMYGEEQKLLLRDKDTVYVLEDMALCIPRTYLPDVECDDYDGDGEKEYAINHIVGSGTGVQMVSLCIIEPTKDGYERYETDLNLLGEELTSHYRLEMTDVQIGELFCDDSYEGMVIFPDWLSEDIDFCVNSIIECIPRRDGLWVTATGSGCLHSSGYPFFDPEILITAPLIYKNNTFSIGKLSTEISYYYYDDEGMDKLNNLTKREICKTLADITQDGTNDIIKVYIKQDEESKSYDPKALLEAGFQGKVCLYDGSDWDVGKFSFKNYYFALPHPANMQMSIVHLNGIDYLMVSQLMDMQGQLDFSYKVFSVTSGRNELCVADNRLFIDYRDAEKLSETQVKEVVSFLEEILEFTDGNKTDAPGEMLFWTDVDLNEECKFAEGENLLPAFDYYREKIDYYKSGKLEKSNTKSR